MRAALDTLEIAKRLRNAGFNEPQAEAVTGALRDAREADLSELATKTDLAQVKGELALLRADLTQFATKSELTQLGAGLRAEIAALRSDIAAVRPESEILRRDLTIRLGSMIVVATGILLAAKFFG